MGDLYKIKLSSVWGGSTPCLNVFYYEQLSGSFEEVVANILLDGFLEQMFVLTPLHAISTSALRYTSVDVENLTHDTWPIAARSINYLGAAAGDSMPAFCAVAFRFYPSVAHRRGGYKRLGGVSESAQSGGLINDSSTLTAMDGIAGGFQERLFGDEAQEFGLQPMIVSFVLNGEPRVTPRTTVISDVAALRKVTTQNTRKR